MDNEYESDQNNLSKENQESFENTFSNNDGFINSNPIYNYMKQEDSKLSKSISMKKEVQTNKVIEEQKNNKFCNLDDPKLIDAYNEGYYGFNNVPKQYYIFPKFSKKFYNKNQEIEEPKNEDRISEIINKENYLNSMNDDKFKNVSKFKNNINDNEFIYSYTNYPYPKLINISSNLFGLSHQLKSNYQNSDKNLINEKEIEQNLENNNDNDDDKDEGNFYFINNNVTARNVPFENIPDDISIDDEEREDQEE